jgi:hypothetical protein
MFRTATSVEMLKPIALIAGLAILLWSLGLPSLSFVEAANVTNFSDTISDSAPSAGADHNIEFTMPTGGAGVPNTGTIELTFPATFDLSGIGEEDIDLLIDGTNKPAAEWSVATTATEIDITIDTGDIGAGSSTQILIGTNATNEGSPNSQIGNPAAEDSYRIDLVAGSDSGSTHVVILTAVTVSASVETVFNFTVSGVTAGGTVNGEAITGDTSSTSIPFGTLEAGSATTSAQALSVSTNAANGYTVTVQTDGNLRSTTGAAIDNFQDGSDEASPTAWAPPTGDVALDNTWGHWGVTSDDDDIFGVAQTFIAASTTPRQIMTHDGPVNGVGVGVGTTTVGYKVEITALQEAGDDYSTTLTYVATPTF